MTNRGTARRMNTTIPKKDDNGKDIPEEKPLNIGDRRAIHRAKHPKDMISFGEEPMIEDVKPKMQMSPKPFLAKDRSGILQAITDEDMGLLMGHSRVRLLHNASDRMSVLRQTADIEAPMLPLDASGEPIPYPAGRGRGKIAIVEWLIKYDERYQDMNTKLILDEEIKQSLLS
jgi:hypothetical protein